jgi:hypothetical protein
MMWPQGDASELFSLVPYPQEFNDYVADAVHVLQDRPAQLLIRIAGRRREPRAGSG